jgi:UDP-glucose 4-epimerase
MISSFLLSEERKKQMKFVVTGGAGFIGSNLIQKLVQDGHDVTVLDKVKPDHAFRLQSIFKQIRYIEFDLENFDELKNLLKGFDVVAHFSASADIALGRTKTDVDLKQGTIVTYNILESMRINRIGKLIFPSTSSVYGNPIKIPTTEDTGMLFPTSLYGASKLAAEGLISAYCHLFGMKSWIFRLGNVVGPNLARGVIKDFIHKLNQNQKELEVLGDGTQQKDFIYISDFLDGLLFAFANSADPVNVFNLSSGTTTSVNKISDMIFKEMNLHNVKITYTGGKSGWPGDAPIVHYDISKIKKLGWKPMYSSDEAVRLAIKDTLKSNNDSI